MKRNKENKKRKDIHWVNGCHGWRISIEGRVCQEENMLMHMQGENTHMNDTLLHGPSFPLLPPFMTSPLLLS